MSVKVKQFELDFVEYNPIIIEDIPGISDIALDYSASIGGAEKPEDGADVTSNNPQNVDWLNDAGDLATLDTVDTAQIVNGAVEKVKMALLSVDADILAASAVTENKLYTGAVTVNKLASNAVTSVKILAGAVIAGKIAANAVTANEINVSLLSAISANIGTVTAGTVTGVLIQTSASSNTGVKMSSALGGIVIYGQTLELRDTSNVLYGHIGGSGGYFNIKTESNRNILLDADAGTIHFGSEAAPLNDLGSNLGFYNFRWGNCFTANVTFQNGYYLNKNGNNLKLNGLNRIEIDGGTFRRVGFTFKDGSGINKYIEVLATADPV